MNPPVSLQAIEEAVTVWDLNDPQRNDAMLENILAAVQAVLDGEPLYWCVVHGAPQERLLPEGYTDKCVLFVSAPCRFESQVRVCVTA